MPVAETYRIRENFIEGKHPKNELDEYQNSLLSKYFTENELIIRNFPKIFNNTDQLNLCLKVDKRIQNDLEHFCFETSYYVGAQWLIKDKLPLLVEPKFNKSKEDKTEVEIDYIKLMTDALEPLENAEHLKDLVIIDFQQNPIKIPQQLDLLSPLLIIQYIHLLKKIVKKGLKNSYYKKHSNLRSKVRGKILISATVKLNHAKSNMLDTYCSYDEFGIDHAENRLLKRGLNFGINYLSQLKNTKSDFSQIDEMLRFIKPAFQNVSEEINIATIKNFQPNPMFKEYNEALKLAKLILKRFGYNHTKTSDKTVETPPFWIDMSKLFELYVLSLLRKRFPLKKELEYQPNFNGWLPDYILNSKDDEFQMVIDAKYKNYNEKSINIDDIRQVSGYARLNSVYNKLGRDKNDNSNIDCLFIYPFIASKQNILEDKLNAYAIGNYRNFYSMEVTLPTIN